MFAPEGVVFRVKLLDASLQVLLLLLRIRGRGGGVGGGGGGSIFVVLHLKMQKGCGVVRLKYTQRIHGLAFSGFDTDTIQYNTTLLSLCREICFLDRVWIVLIMPV